MEGEVGVSHGSIREGWLGCMSRALSPFLGYHMPGPPPGQMPKPRIRALTLTLEGRGPLASLTHLRIYLTMSLTTLVNGENCGPVNPLQGLTKALDSDRGVQRVCAHDSSVHPFSVNKQFHRTTSELTGLVHHKAYAITCAFPCSR